MSGRGASVSRVTPRAAHVADIEGWDGAEELVEILAAGNGTSVERIVSRGHTTGWCDQDHDEWVLVHQGAARLEFEDGSCVELGPGDHILLPAHCVHRVAWTDPAVNTVWVAVHLPA